jgi:hypothetical protein
MLKPEAAREQLSKLESRKHRDARTTRLKKLPKALAKLGMEALGEREDYSTFDYDKLQRAKLEAMEILEAKPKDRAKFFAALYPTLAKDLEAAWNFVSRLPYSRSGWRRPFRSPGNIGLYSEYRSEWLNNFVNATGSYPDDLLSTDWLASWNVFLNDYYNSIGIVLAATIDRGGKEGDTVLQIAQDCAANRHAIGGPSKQAIQALLASSNQQGWEFAEKLLIAAQKQEGLRQSILEMVDESHPQAYLRMLRLLIDENLLRFASVARAASVWTGEIQSVLTPKQLKDLLEEVYLYLSNPKKRSEAITSPSGNCYRGLWAEAFFDVDKAIAKAKPLLKDKNVERRLEAVKFLAATGLHPAIGPLLLPLLDESDLRILSILVREYRILAQAKRPLPPKLFEKLEKILPTLPDKQKVVEEGLGISKQEVADLLYESREERPVERLLPHLFQMSSWQQLRTIDLLIEPRTLTDKVRELLLTLAGHPSGSLRDAAFKGLEKCKIAEDEAQTLEGYLTRKNAELRRGTLKLLLNRTDKATLGSVERLTAAKDAQQRQGGLELARQMVEKERQAPAVLKLVTAYRDRAKKLSKEEAETIDHLLNPKEKPATLDDCLGLVKAGARTPPTQPVKKKIQFATPASIALVRELNEFIHENRAQTFSIKAWNNSHVECVLGSASRWNFSETGQGEEERYFPLKDLWKKWWESRSDKTRDKDGLEAIRALGLSLKEVREGEESSDEDEPEEKSPAKNVLSTRQVWKQLHPNGSIRLRYAEIITALLHWLVKEYPPAGAADFLLDATETTFALIPDDLLSFIPDPQQYFSTDWRQNSSIIHWQELASQLKDKLDWQPHHNVRFYGLLRWKDEPGTKVERIRPQILDLVAAYRGQGATVSDFIDDLIGPRATQSGYWYYRSGDSLNQLTQSGAKAREIIADAPELLEALDRCVERILEVELARGEWTTAATPLALKIASLSGRTTLLRILKVLGKTPFAKIGYSFSETKPSVLTHLIRNTHPLPEDTPELFAEEVRQAIKAGEIAEDRILELAMLNPRWVLHVEKVVGWKGFSEGVWWFLAHTSNEWNNQYRHGSDAEETEAAMPWITAIKSRTNLTPEQRAEGIVDVNWFHAVYKAIGKDAHWDRIEESAKFLGYGQGHKKAARLADVLLGRSKKKELVDGIRQKNLKEYVRLLGLLPLPTKASQRESELHDRHKVLKEYERYARGLSSLSREPAMQASRLGLENLAITAGYSDPLRLEWAVGAKEVEDFLKGPVKLKVKEVEITLALDPLGSPEFSQTKSGKELKSIPPDLKKLPKVEEIVERNKSLKKLASSNRRSLEMAMCQGDQFTAEEMQQLLRHALVRPLIQRLVLQAGDVRGYLTDDGKSLRDWNSKVRAIPADTAVIIAHPLDLLAAGDWHEWQAECFRSERLQPFKQIFREVYTVTAQEKDDGTKSQRYAGQQLNPNQAMALFGSRGWSTREGVNKYLRECGIFVEVNFDHGYTTPGEVEGLTVHSVTFRHRDDWKPALVTDIPVKVFSEVMRDLDLVVSVAHVGGVDPEASASTVEMRTILLKETCTLLKAENVKFNSRHALIEGKYGSYSVHLGSGVVHKQPGGSLCIVPIHAQHRGRLFLPFADDDPRTAEVVSKVLLLARDSEIQDPTILEQIANR